MKKRSLPSILVAGLMRLMYPERKTEQDVLADKTMSPAVNDVPYTLPKKPVFDDLREEIVNEAQVFHINEHSAEKTLVLYLHGGGYVHQPSVFHWLFVKRLIRETNCKVCVPIYPKAPNHQYDEAYRLLDQVYGEILGKYADHRIIFMGDSAGGGLALGFAQTLPAKGLRSPDATVLFSPWLDITMQNEEARQYEKSDPILSILALQVWGKLWAGDTDAKDARLSPMFGELSNLRRVLLFTGTREVFYPDELLFAKKLKDAGIEHRLVIGEGMNHIYPCLPIPEAADAMKEIVVWITE